MEENQHRQDDLDAGAIIVIRGKKEKARES
jgi:hypothetical protein